LEEAVLIDPRFVAAMSDLARLLATCSDDKLRDSKRAMKLAAKASELIGGKDPVVLDALAAAYAEPVRSRRAKSYLVRYGREAVSICVTCQFSLNGMLHADDGELVIAAGSWSVEQFTRPYEVRSARINGSSPPICLLGYPQPRNKWNTKHGAVHLIQPTNNLFAEVMIAAQASILRKRPDGTPITDSDELIRCSGYGEPWRSGGGCNKVSAECKHCYIGPIMKRGGYEPFQDPMRTKDWCNPVKWDRAAAKAGQRQRVLSCSMSDFFHEGADAWRAEAWEVIRMCSHLDWLILTKRPELVRPRLPADWGEGYANVWLDVTCGCSASLDRLPILRDLPAVVKFVSAEPFLERMDFRPHLDWIDWIITGCERAARGQRAVMDLDWVRDIDAQCKARGKRHFFKQAYIDERGVPSETPRLDGSVVQEIPERRMPLTMIT
jgi:protein gp37